MPSQKLLCSCIGSLFLSVVLAQSTFQDGKDCTEEHRLQVEGVLSQLTLLGTPRRYPETLPEAAKFCRDQRSLLGFAKAYSFNCLTDYEEGESLPTVINNNNSSFPSNFNNLIEDIERGSDLLCKRFGEPQSARFIGVGHCINQASAQISATCLSKYSSEVLMFETNSDNENTEQICCAYQRLFSCIRFQIVVQPGCTSTQARTFTNFLEALLEQSYERKCAEYVVNHQVLCANVQSPLQTSNFSKDDCITDNCSLEENLLPSTRPLIYQLANL